MASPFTPTTHPLSSLATVPIVRWVTPLPIHTQLLSKAYCIIFQFGRLVGTVDVTLIICLVVMAFLLTPFTLCCIPCAFRQECPRCGYRTGWSIKIGCSIRRVTYYMYTPLHQYISTALKFISLVIWSDAGSFPTWHKRNIAGATVLIVFVNCLYIWASK